MANHGRASMSTTSHDSLGLPHTTRMRFGTPAVHHTKKGTRNTNEKSRRPRHISLATPNPNPRIPRPPLVPLPRCHPPPKTPRRTVAPGARRDLSCKPPCPLTLSPTLSETIDVAGLQSVDVWGQKLGGYSALQRLRLRSRADSRYRSREAEVGTTQPYGTALALHGSNA